MAKTTIVRQIGSKTSINSNLNQALKEEGSKPRAASDNSSNKDKHRKDERDER